MSELQILSSLATIHLSWSQSIRVCFVRLCFSMISYGRSQHKDLGSLLGSKAASARRRVERFFAKQILNPGEIASLILGVLGLHGPWGLAIDRTNWKFGTKDLNFLVLSLIVNQTVGIPLFWKALPKKGNSSSQERIDLLQHFIDIFGASQILYVIGDREFIGQKWLGDLNQRGIKFYVRLRENIHTTYDDSVPSKVLSFFDHLKTGERRLLLNQHMGGQSVCVAGTRSRAGDLVIICTNDTDTKAHQILSTYLKRWSIETAFRNLKTRGFNIEDTHMTALPRIELLMGIAAVALAFCVKIGFEQEQKKKIPFRKTVQSNLISIFQNGLRYLKNILANLLTSYLTHPPETQPPQHLAHTVG